jgi:hypothetical protein
VPSGAAELALVLHASLPQQSTAAQTASLPQQRSFGLTGHTAPFAAAPQEWFVTQVPVSMLQMLPGSVHSVSCLQPTHWLLAQSLPPAHSSSARHWALMQEPAMQSVPLP